MCQTECDSEAPIIRRPWSTRGFCAGGGEATHGTRINITIFLEKGDEIILNCCKMNGTGIFIPTFSGWGTELSLSNSEL